VEKSGSLPPKCRKTVCKVHERLERLLAHDDCPRLVHWDLWSTNVLARADGAGAWHVAAFLDPACKFAHCEAELAYLELFHTCNGAFLRAYQQPQRLTSDYHRVRKPIYQLYSMINHLCCHGPEHGHLKQTIDAIERVAAVV
jgi:fructosamine-3-kinase